MVLSESCEVDARGETILASRVRRSKSRDRERPKIRRGRAVTALGKVTRVCYIIRDSTAALDSSDALGAEPLSACEVPTPTFAVQASEEESMLRTDHEYSVESSPSLMDDLLGAAPAKLRVNAPLRVQALLSLLRLASPFASPSPPSYFKHLTPCLTSTAH